nr:unnamed protein product [Callosobruchus analis]
MLKANPHTMRIIWMVPCLATNPVKDPLHIFMVKIDINGLDTLQSRTTTRTII